MRGRSKAKTRTPEQQHRRQVRNQIMLPMLGVTGLFALALLLTLVGLGGRISMIADLFLTVCILVPMALLCFMGYALFAVMAIGLWRGNTLLAPSLARLRHATLRGLRTVQSRAPALAKPMLAMQTQLGYWERLLAGRPQGVESSPEEEQTYGR